MSKKVAVVAIGGNSLIKDKNHQTVEDQYQASAETAHHIADMIEAGWDVAIGHGNGPQVGFILRRSEIAAKTEGMHEIPLDVCGADSQGAIGYALQQCLQNEFYHRGIKKNVATVITQTLVDKNDPAFKKPSKPIGGFMDEAEAKRREHEMGWTVVEDAGRGWRRVVPSPAPIRIVQQDVIMTLAKAGFTVIGVGGGGIPVIENQIGDLVGVEAVIDKDLASALLASGISADLFLISTDVEKVAVDFHTPTERWLDHLTISEAKRHLAEGQFGKGSMEPKIEAALNFLDHGGKRVIITNTKNMILALNGKTGTHILA